ncbi:D-alanine--poly(phosphoribitol) ligase subunit 1 [Streptomyces sp. SAI-144]|uniref:AMP-binding protein n=1 Tax=unclassified Streptomyces TaxID=2593676 RepID=UPI002476F551|nr:MULTISPECIES: AMP-binding protein [unclassified Streptomyces]MDH6440269.1 D-alanine--poly(phosphoribitol) ligase subunit 1 [Streptomyces sp. SAI-144]MDH6487586.1 D-alanine--poly(phosphoribitol) ligase subunit 1 [Streptomyces sp. SAI-127]
MAEELIHQAVARHAAIRPDATALVHRNGTVTYRELADRAQQWARALRQEGAGPGQYVAVCLPRSPDLVTALLAVLTTGAAYAALDPRWPAERTAAVLERLAPVRVITQDRLPEPAAAHPGVGDTEPSQLHGGSPACVFFTSGTSGAPKGVVSPHRATMRLFAPDGPLAFGPGAVLPVAAATPWDAFSLELWGALTTGGTGVLVESDYLLPPTLEELTACHGVNTAWLTASLFNLFVEDAPESFTGLERLYIGGERLSPSHVSRFLRAHPDIALYNGYGPVESCVFATVHRIREEDCLAPDGIPLGSPVPATAVHVLDGVAEAAPGEVGELCVSGDGLAVGYLADDALTEACFSRVRLRDGERVRVYRTGDLGYADERGRMRFTGRSDRQFKVRGHRLEPEEIESCAATLAPVTRSTVVPIPGELGTYDGIALFYTGDDGPSAAADDGECTEIRALLGRRLPSYAVPDVVTRVDRFPVTGNGKVDSRALLALLDAGR